MSVVIIGVFLPSWGLKFRNNWAQLPIWHQLLATSYQPRDPFYGVTLSQNHLLHSDLLPRVVKGLPLQSAAVAHRPSFGMMINSSMSQKFGEV
jgi:hypothetical protein